MAMTFDEAEQRYADLQQLWQAQSLDRDEFIEAVNQLRLQDQNGDWWQIRGSDGVWLRWDGENWYESQRPVFEAAPPPPMRIDQTMIDSEWHLIPLNGGQAYPLRGTIVLGRDPRCDITIADPKVSRQHAKIQPFQDEWVVNDEGSSNGTYVNEVQITQPTVIQAGTHLKIGGKVFVLHDKGEKSLNPAYVVSVAPNTAVPPQPVYSHPPLVAPVEAKKRNRLLSCFLLLALFMVCLVVSIGVGLYLVNSGLILQ